MSNNTKYVRDAFKSLELVEDKEFDLFGKDSFEELGDFIEDEDDVAVEQEVIDLDAEEPEELKDSYVGDVILGCPVCHTNLFKAVDDVVIDEETELCCVGEACPVCGQEDGFKVIGKVAPFEEVEEEEETEVEVETEPDDAEVEVKEKVRESFKQRREAKKLQEQKLGRSRRILKEKVCKDCGKEVCECDEKKLVETPVYDLNPRFDSRQSFYGKAKVDTGDKNDKNKLYSYNTLVAEIKDGKPVVYGTYSQTTLRHIKDWLKQNGFKADNAKQIIADYGVKDESCKEVNEDVPTFDVTDQVIVKRGEPGFISKMHELRDKGYKCISSGDGQMCFAKPKELKTEKCEALTESKHDLQKLPQDIQDIVGKHFDYTMDFDFLDIVADILLRIDDFEDADVWDEIDSTLIYTDDQWRVLWHYVDSPEDLDSESWSDALGNFAADLESICGEIAEARQGEEEEEVKESLTEETLNELDTTGAARVIKRNSTAGSDNSGALGPKFDGVYQHDVTAAGKAFNNYWKSRIKKWIVVKDKTRKTNKDCYRMKFVVDIDGKLCILTNDVVTPSDRLWSTDKYIPLENLKDKGIRIVADNIRTYDDVWNKAQELGEKDHLPVYSWWGELKGPIPKKKEESFPTRKLKESDLYKDSREVPDVAYDMASEIDQRFSGQKLISWDDFNQAFEDAYPGLIDWTDDDFNDLETDVRGILGMYGWETIFEGDNEGGLEQIVESKQVNESLEDIKSEWENRRGDNIFEFPSGDYVHVGIDFDKKTIYAGGATNTGIFRDTEIDLDEDDSLDGNLMRLYDAITEEHPEYFETNESLKEDIEKATIETEDQVIKVSSEPKEEDMNADWFDRESMGEGELLPDGGEEMIAPLDDADIQEIEDAQQPEEEPTEETEVETGEEEAPQEAPEEMPEEEEEEAEEVQEESFKRIAETYLKKVYSNVKSFEINDKTFNEGLLTIDGTIEFNSGKKKTTTFVFEAVNNNKTIAKSKKEFVGLNKTFTDKKDAFVLATSINDKKLVAESLSYDYPAKTKGLTEGVKTVKGIVK